MKAKGKNQEILTISGFFAVKCPSCSSQSYFVDLYLISEEEFFNFKCSNKKCRKIFAPDYNSYIYETWEDTVKQYERGTKTLDKR